MDPWYLENLVCPLDRSPLSYRDGSLVSQAGQKYPVVDGVPVMLIAEAEQTIGVATSSLARAWGENVGVDLRASHLYLESLGISEAEKEGLVRLARSGGAEIDPVVAYMIGATSGITYKHLIGTLSEYPIPDLRLPDSDGGLLLDLGCNWGRWSIAAARKGYRVTGIDPSLGAIMAARRVARQLNLPIKYVVADARYLPFKDSSFGVAFSYSVLQHLSKANVVNALSQVRRVLRPHSMSLIQMPNWLGVRSLYHQARRKFREAKNFEVRYWSIRELKRVFEREVGPSVISVDCYFGLGLQKSDEHLMSPLVRCAIALSERLRSLSEKFRAIRYFADSVYVASVTQNEKST